MALHNREICKVGDSPTRGRRSASPRRMMTVVTEDDCEADCSRAGASKLEPESPKSPKMSISPRLTPSPSSSTPPTPELLKSPSKSDRRISARLLMQKNDKSDSLLMKGSKSPKHNAWKTSKFFSRSMASGELLKGLKKLSTSNTTPTTAIEEPNNDVSKSSESKSFKNRFSSLRRKSGSDTDTVPAVDDETLKLGSTDVRGIVAKKEDIISLINVASKERRVSSPGDLKIQSTLPTTAVPVLKSPSLKVPPGSPLNRGSFRTCRSASLDPTIMPNERSTFRSQIKVPVKTIVHPPPKSPRDRISDDLCIKKSSFLDVTPEFKRRLSGPLIEIKENKILETNGSNEATGTSEEEPAVQWDEGNFVDPNLLGGAIEAFLKGMGSGPGPSGSEKRVSFKKS